MTGTKLLKGHAVAFDFDGVIHKYSEGWKDGSIYDEVNVESIKMIHKLQEMGIPCLIISTRNPNQIKEWWDKQDFSIRAEVLDEYSVFFNDCSFVGITNKKFPAQLYIDDRAYLYENQTCETFFSDMEDKDSKNSVTPMKEAEDTEGRRKIIERYKEELVGKVFRHFKGNLYRVLNVGVNSETLEFYVVYQSVRNELDVWVRSYDSFISEIDYEKYPITSQKLRFEPVNVNMNESPSEEVSSSNSLPRVHYLGFSEHDRQAHYMCPICGHLFGSYGILQFAGKRCCPNCNTALIGLD